MTLLIIFGVIVLFWIIDLIRWFVTRKEAKRAAIRADFMHAEQLEALKKVEIAFNNSKLDVVDRNSIKRHIATLLRRLDEVEQTIEQFNQPFIVDGDNLDLEALAEQISKQPATVVSDDPSIERIVPKSYWDARKEREAKDNE